MSDEFVETGVVTVPIHEIEYETAGAGTLLVTFIDDDGNVAAMRELPETFVGRLKHTGWNVTRIWPITRIESDDPYMLKLPMCTRVPDEDVPAMFVDERPL